MTTNAFQVIFDKAESISINTRATVAQSISRSNVVRSIKRGGQVWRFEVKMPDGMSWQEIRPYIAAIDNADRFTNGVVQLNNSGYNDWLTKYQGNAADPTFAMSWIQGNSYASITQSPTITSGYRFRKGDIVQLGGGHCYTVTEDVGIGSSDLTVNFNRPIIDETKSWSGVFVGPACSWTVICTQIPNWTIYARDQVAWSGPFVFYEAML